MIEKLNKDWFLPTLQRDFVWLEKEKDKKVEKLLDSLMLGYPIGQIVIWKNQNAQEINTMKVYRFLNHYEINGKNENGSQSFGETTIEALVLDGQQRLTSLYIATKGYILDKDKKTKKYLYLNLLYDANKNAVDEVTYKFDFKSEEDANKVDEKNLWFRISLLVDNKNHNDYTDYKRSIIKNLLSKLPKEMTSTMEQIIDVRDKIDSILNKLWSNVREKEINCEIAKTDNIDNLLEIFVRLNDGGVKLEKADLLLSFMESDSKLFQPHGARETISHFVNETINNRSGELSDKVTINKDFVLKAALMLSKNPENPEKNLEIKYKIKNFTTNNLATISTNWTNITKTIETVYKLIDRYHFSDKTLTSYNALLPIAYYLQKNGLNKKTFVDSPEISYVEKRVMLINWLSKVLISGVFGGSSDTILKQYQEAIDSDSSSLNVLNSKKITQKDIEDLVEKSTYKDKYSQLILFLVTDPKYWHNSQDHIFPQNEFKGTPSECKKRMNSIGNLQLLSQPANSHKNGTSALDWASLISDEEKKANLYPDDIELKNENFVQFVEERKKLIIKKLCEKLEVEYKKDV